MTARDLFAAGDLTGAIAAQTQEVKGKPTDIALRTFLFELLCFAGQWDRAEKQLDVIAQQDPKTDWSCQVYKNLLEAERRRQRLWSEGLKPDALLDPPAYLHHHFEALNRIREGRGAEAKAALDQSADERPLVPGQIDGTPFDDFRDCDDLLAPVLEFFIQRDYAWVPFDQLKEIEISPPERPRDLIWVPVRLVLQDDTQRRGYVPVLYANSPQHANPQVQLGRMTDWNLIADGPVLGLGQRTFLAGDSDRPLLETRQITFTAP